MLLKGPLERNNPLILLICSRYDRGYHNPWQLAFRTTNRKGSSAESVGGCRLGQIPKCMISGDFCDVEGPKSAGFCHGQIRLVVQAMVRAAAKRLWTCGQRKRVAHMPTATTTDAGAYQCLISKQAITVARTPGKHVKPPTDSAEEASRPRRCLVCRPPDSSAHREQTT